MLAIACGYEDGDDLDHLRTDPGFKLACGRLPDGGRDLCSQPTVSRLENTPDLRQVIRLTHALVDLYCASIDDCAWKRNYRYGTLICDLERRRAIALLPRALPGAVQVADRWHLMENASQAFLAATRACMRQVRAAVGAATVDPRLLPAAEKLQYEGYLRREDVNAAILALHKVGKPIKEIARCTGHSRRTVRRVLRGHRAEEFRTRENSQEAHLPWLSRKQTVIVATIETAVPTLVQARDLVDGFQT